MNKKNNRYTDEFKRQIVKEVVMSENCALISRRYNLVYGTVKRWVLESRKSNKDMDVITKENEQLKKILVEKELEIVSLKDFLKTN